MSIKKKTPEQLKDLQTTLQSNPHIEEVHFAANGDHYFTKHELEDKIKKTKKAYGYLNAEPILSKVQGERKIFKIGPVHTAHAEIMESISRDKILAMKATDAKGENTDALKAKIAELELANEVLKSQK